MPEQPDQVRPVEGDDPFTDIRNRAAATALGDTAETGEAAVAQHLQETADDPDFGRNLARNNPTGHLAALFRQAGVDLEQEQLEQLLQLPDDQFGAEILGQQSPLVPRHEVADVSGGEILGQQSRQASPTAPPQGFTADPQDPTVFIAPDGRRFRLAE